MIMRAGWDAWVALGLVPNSREWLNGFRDVLA